MASAATGINFDAPYQYPEQAVRDSYRIEAQAIVQVSAFISSMMGSTSPRRFNPNLPRTPHERHAQAAMIHVMIARHLTQEEQLVIRARCTVPEVGMLERRKSADCRLLLNHVVLDATKRERVDRRYADDAVRGWAGYKRQQTEAEWAKRLNVTQSTLYRWRYGNASRRRSNGFITMLHGIEEIAMGKLIEPLFEAGLTEE